MNPAAFPFSRPAGGSVISEGLTKRELIAAMIMQGLVSNQDNSPVSVYSVAHNAVFAANALLNALATLEPTA